MKDAHEITETAAEAAAPALPEFLTPDATLLLATWICFFALLIVLKKYAWNPILEALDTREEAIKKSVEDAATIQREMQQLAETQRLMVEEAEEQAKAIIEDGRKAAKEAARHITDKAREEAQIILQNAERDIKEQVKDAQASLRETGAAVAVELASKIMEEHLDEAKSKKLVSKYIDEL